MKKCGLLLLSLCVVLLAACGARHTVSGQVTEMESGGENETASFILRSAEDGLIGVRMTDKTRFLSAAGDLTAETFAGGAWADVKVLVTRGRKKGTLTTADGKDVPAYEAEEIDITEVRTQETALLPDGTKAEIWRGARETLYCLEDGTELLGVQDASGPENSYVGGLESFDDLSAAAQDAVRTFYKEQGLLYQVQDELEKAYEAYTEGGEGTAFRPHVISQSVSPSAANERVMYFITAASFFTGGDDGYERRLGAAFDRETGRAISGWELFSCTPEQAVQKILELSKISDPVLRAEMEAAFDPAQIIFFPDTLEVSFSKGTLPSQTHDYGLGLDYGDELRGILQAWAVPQNKK